MTKHDDRVVTSRFAAGLLIVALLASVVLFGMCALELSILNAVHDGGSSVQAKSLLGQPRSQSPPPSAQLLRGGYVATSMENQGTEWACTGASNSIGEMETGNGRTSSGFMATKRESRSTLVFCQRLPANGIARLLTFCSLLFPFLPKKGCDTKVEHLPPFDPLVWGPFAWKLLHTMGVSYPDTPDEAHIAACNNFMNRSFFIFVLGLVFPFFPFFSRWGCFLFKQAIHVTSSLHTHTPHTHHQSVFRTCFLVENVDGI
jgi:hypothetical protein